MSKLENSIRRKNRSKVPSVSEANTRTAFKANGSTPFSLLKPGFNRDILVIATALLSMTVVLRFMHLELQGMRGTVGSLLLLVPCILPVFVHGRQTGRPYWSDIVFMTYCTMVLNYLIRIPVLISARLGSAFPLRDRQLIRFDQAFGVYVPAIMNWSSTHRLGRVANESYSQILGLMMTAAVLPAVMGRVKDSHRFVRAILIGFLIGIPLFVVVPAVGPWYGYHVASNPLQMRWEANLLLIRNPSTVTVNDVSGVIGFPSFHVSWVITAVYGLWPIRWMRAPAAALATMITLSTLTGGYHYLADVLGGIVVASASCCLAEKWQRRDDNLASTFGGE